MQAPNKLYIAADLLGKSVCEKSDGFYYWEGSEELSTQKLTSSELAQVDTEYAARQAEYVAKEYQRNRAAEYPSFAEQFDTLYHGGYDAWKAQVDAIKLKYPKV